MEYTKKLKILSLAILVLTATYISGIVFSSANISKRRSNEKLVDEKLIEKISSIKIDMEEGAIEMIKDGDNWYYSLNGTKYPAASDKIDNFIDSVSSVTKFQLAGSDEKSWEKFELGEEKSKKAVFSDSDGNELFTFHTGKAGPVQGGGEYVRLSLSPESYLIESSIARYFMRDRIYWSDLKMMPENISNKDITSVKIRSDFSFETTTLTIDFHVVKQENEKDSEWKNMIIDKKPDSYRVDLMLNIITSLSGDSFSEKAVTSPDTVIELGTKNHGTIVIKAQSIGEEEYLAEISGKDLTYSLTTYKIERILNSINSIYEEKSDETNEN